MAPQPAISLTVARSGDDAAPSLCLSASGWMNQHRGENESNSFTNDRRIHGVRFRIRSCDHRCKRSHSFGGIQRLSAGYCCERKAACWQSGIRVRQRQEHFWRLTDLPRSARQIPRTDRCAAKASSSCSPSAANQTLSPFTEQLKLSDALQPPVSSHPCSNFMQPVT